MDLAQYREEVLQRLTHVETEVVGVKDTLKEQRKSSDERWRLIDQRLTDMHVRLPANGGGLRNALSHVGLGIALVASLAGTVGAIVAIGVALNT